MRLILIILSLWLDVSNSRHSLEVKAVREIKRCGGDVAYEWSVFYPFHTVSVVAFTGRGVTDDTIKSVTPLLGSLPNLSHLQIIQASITDDSMDEVASLKRVKKLDLWDNQISDFGVSRLAPLSDLHELDLSATLVSDDSAPILRALRLKCLKLPGGLPAGATNDEPFTIERREIVAADLRPQGIISEKCLKELRAECPHATIERTTYSYSGDFNLGGRSRHVVL